MVRKLFTVFAEVVDTERSVMIMLEIVRVGGPTLPM